MWAARLDVRRMGSPRSSRGGLPMAGQPATDAASVAPTSRVVPSMDGGAERGGHGAAAQRHHHHDGVAPIAIAMISLPAAGMVRARGAGCSSPRRLPRRRDARLASARHVVGGAKRLARAKCCHETTNASMMARDGRDGTSRSHGVGERPGGVARNGDLVPYPVEGDVLPYGRECGWPVRAASATHKLPGGRSCARETFLPAP